MNNEQHTILCVDDEENILHSLKRLLRREDYRLLTATSGAAGLEIMRREKVQLVISDQRMPEMSGVEFLARIRDEYPDVIRIVLTGYTNVDSITESINEGHIFKFLLKPWNDQNLKLEIKQALDQYDLIQANRRLSEQILEHNERLRIINEELESRVLERTRDLEIQNHALELSRAILEDLPFPIIGVGSEGMVVLMNREALNLPVAGGVRVEIGNSISDCFSNGLMEKVSGVFATSNPVLLKGYGLSGSLYDIEIRPLSSSLRGKGVILALRSASSQIS